MDILLVALEVTLGVLLGVLLRVQGANRRAITELERHFNERNRELWKRVEKVEDDLRGKVEKVNDRIDRRVNGRVGD